MPTVRGCGVSTVDSVGGSQALRAALTRSVYDTDGSVANRELTGATAGRFGARGVNTGTAS